MRPYNIALDPDVRSQFGAVFEFEDTKTQTHFGVSLATLLQCLCIAEQRFLVPPFEPDWEALAIPSALRGKARLSEQRESAQARPDAWH